MSKKKKDKNVNKIIRGIGNINLDDNLPWIDKYKPTKLKDFIGNLNKLIEIKDWLKNWIKSKSKPIIIFGKTGSGKTTLAHIVSQRYKYNVLEINSSDERTSKKLQKLKLLVQTNSPFTKDILLIDDIEVSPDPGFIKFVGELLQITKMPIILTCSDKYERKIKTIKKKCRTIELQYPSDKQIFNFLSTIMKNEYIKVDKNLINSLISNSKGDIRYCIINLQFYSKCNKTKELDYTKEKKYNIFDGSSLLFNNKVDDKVKQDIINSDRFMFSNYIEHNLINTSNNFEQILERTSLMADVDNITHSINSHQNFNLIPYQTNLLLGIVRNSKKRRIEFPSNIGKISKMNSQKIKRRKLLPNNMKMQDFDFVKNIFYNPIITPTIETCEKTYQMMVNYGWTIDDWKNELFVDNTLNVQKLEKKEITKRKTKFIKFYNKKSKI